MIFMKALTGRRVVAVEEDAGDRSYREIIGPHLWRLGIDYPGTYTVLVYDTDTYQGIVREIVVRVVKPPSTNIIEEANPA